MKKAKIKQIKQKKEKEIVQTQDTMSGKSVIITFLSIIIIFSAFYFLTDFLIFKRTSPSSNSNTNETSNIISFTEMLKQSDDEYYVLAVIQEEEIVYERYAGSTGKKYYKIDMDNIMNSSHISDETSIGESVKDIKIADSTLFVIKDGKIIEHFTGKKDIIDYLQKNLKVESSNSNS